MLFAIVHEVTVVTQSQLSDQTYKYAAEQEYIYNATGILTNVAADVLGIHPFYSTPHFLIPD